MKAVHALEAYELDYHAAQAINEPVRIGPSPSGEHRVCWFADRKVMFSPSTRWRQTSKFLLLLAREGRLVLTGGDARTQSAVFYPTGTLLEVFIGQHETSLSVALMRCFVTWKYGPEVQDVPV